MLLFTAMGPWTISVAGAEMKEMNQRARITIAYNNIPHALGLTTSWGFSAVIESVNGRILFDTGGDGSILLSNLRRLRVAPTSIDVLVLSHLHADHTGGLEEFLAVRSDVTIYMPRSFPKPFLRSVERYGARVVIVCKPQRLFANFHSTGEMGEVIKEQALIIDAGEGLALLTGCAHPCIVEVVRTAREYLKKEVHLLMGGFHLLGLNKDKLRSKIQMLRSLGIRRVAPSHCTGNAAIALFRESWGSGFIEGGCGAIVEVP